MVAPIHQGKQQRHEPARRGRQGKGDEAGLPPQEPAGEGYTQEHDQVFGALAEAERQHGGEGVHLDEIARASQLPKERTRALLHDLVAAHRLVTELQGSDAPDLGPRYETKPRL